MWIQKCSTTLQQRKPLDKLTLSTKIQRFSMWGIGQNLSLPYGYTQLQLGVPSGFPEHPQFRNLVLVGKIRMFLGPSNVAVQYERGMGKNSFSLLRCASHDRIPGL